MAEMVIGPDPKSHIFQMPHIFSTSFFIIYVYIHYIYIYIYRILVHRFGLPLVLSKSYGGEVVDYSLKPHESRQAVWNRWAGIGLGLPPVVDGGMQGFRQHQ